MCYMGKMNRCLWSVDAASTWCEQLKDYNHLVGSGVH
ncbi:hypothetical protein E2C01_052358 [Portunus trituberculatus]|uniref:Uncharacterized protein n=1 Tax=Portunus trituberculatus TaxID=210409 RepID=A0A5B7GLB9_PORTR|nr:hypothetical protein [Portunus trituberculatus]